VHQLWPAVQEDERMRGVVFFGGRVLAALRGRTLIGR
jgi:hypothetical protein